MYRNLCRGKEMDANQMSRMMMNQDVSENRQFLQKEVGGGKYESCNRIKEGNGRLTVRGDDVQNNGRSNIEDLSIFVVLQVR